MKPMLYGGSCAEGESGTRFDRASSAVVRGPGVGEEGAVGGLSE